MVRPRRTRDAHLLEPPHEKNRADRRRSALRPWLFLVEAESVSRGQLDHDGRCGRVGVVARHVRRARLAHLHNKFRFREQGSPREQRGRRRRGRKQVAVFIFDF